MNTPHSTRAPSITVAHAMPRILGLLLIFAGFIQGPAFGQGAAAYLWQNLAGMPGGIGNVDGSGPNARFNGPSGVAVDISGNVYVADANNNTIRLISNGVVTTLAGSPGQIGSGDGVGPAASFNYPGGVAVDGAGNVYVTDSFNYTIRVINTNGTVTTLAGSPGLQGSADGTNGTARFFIPVGIAVDIAGNLYVADSGNSTIRKVTSAGVVTTLAGAPGQTGYTDGTNATARFDLPTSLALDSGGNIYVADYYNSTIRMVTSAGVVTTFAGSPMTNGSTDGTNGSALFFLPDGVAVDAATNIYVSDSHNDTIRKITAAGVVTTLAGTPGSPGGADGTNAAAQFRDPAGLAVDGAGNIFVADNENDTIRQVTSAGVVTTLAGSQARDGNADGTNNLAQFNNPYGVTVDSVGNVYVADTDNNTIRTIIGGVVATLAGSPGQSGSLDGTNSGALFNRPTSLAIDAVGNIYVADSYNNDIRKITTNGVVSIFAGSTNQYSGSVDGTNNTALFYIPSALVVDGSGNIYVADTGNNTIRKITPDGVVTTFAGNPAIPGSADGTNNTALFNGPSGLAVDGFGNIFVADTYNNTIRMVNSNGVSMTLAGNASQPGGSVDGTNGAARFYLPRGLALDGIGNLYVADSQNSTIRMVSTNGVVTTIGGQPNQATSADGPGTEARFSFPNGIAVDTSGNLYVADTANNRVSIGSPITGVPIVGASMSSSGVTIFWPATFSNYHLQQIDSLTDTNGWQSAPYQTQSDGTNISVSLPSPIGNAFFRLHTN